MREDLLGMANEERQEAVNVGGSSSDVAEGDMQVNRQTSRIQAEPSETQVCLVVDVICKEIQNNSF